MTQILSLQEVYIQHSFFLCLLYDLLLDNEKVGGTTGRRSNNCTAQFVDVSGVSGKTHQP